MSGFSWIIRVKNVNMHLSGPEAVHSVSILREKAPGQKKENIFFVFSECTFISLVGKIY